MMLHSRMLRYLDEVARAGSIRKAADRLNIASSAINRQILTLEQELGTPIFERLRKRLRLTATGELLIAHVRQTLREHERMRARIEDLRGLRHGKVVIATMGGLAGSILPAIITAFRQRHPGAQTVVTVLPVGEIMAALANGEAELGLGFDLPEDAALRVSATFECKLGAVVRPGHPLAGLRSVSLSACLGYPIILPATGLTLRRTLDDAFARSTIKIVPVLETNAIELIKRTAMLDLGIGFLNVVDVAEERRRGELAFVPLSDRHVKPQLLKLAHRAKGGLDPLANLVAEEIQSTFEALVGTR
jgi:DNA-binding transcriptional LysR family regulator